LERLNGPWGIPLTVLVNAARLTCGLRIVPIPTSDNLTPQETTKQDIRDMGIDGAELSCPGSSVVADSDVEDAF